VWARTDRSLPVHALTGDPRLFEDLATFFASRGMTTIVTALTARYVSNPSAGEEVKGHAVVAAELGLAAYRGPAIRDPASFDGDWSRERRAEHLVARLAFVSAMFTFAGRSIVELYRGRSFDGPVNWRPAGTFVSATFHRPIAEAQAELGLHRSAGVLFSQRVHVERLVMTYFETAAMNTPFQKPKPSSSRRRRPCSDRGPHPLAITRPLGSSAARYQRRERPPDRDVPLVEFAVPMSGHWHVLALWRGVGPVRSRVRGSPSWRGW
jgi:hypothetical protein